MALRLASERACASHLSPPFLLHSVAHAVLAAASANLNCLVFSPNPSLLVALPYLSPPSEQVRPCCGGGGGGGPAGRAAARSEARRGQPSRRHAPPVRGPAGGRQPCYFEGWIQACKDQHAPKDFSLFLSFLMLPRLAHRPWRRCWTSTRHGSHHLFTRTIASAARTTTSVAFTERELGI